MPGARHVGPGKGLDRAVRQGKGRHLRAAWAALMALIIVLYWQMFMGLPEGGVLAEAFRAYVSILGVSVISQHSRCPRSWEIYRHVARPYLCPECIGWYEPDECLRSPSASPCRELSAFSARRFQRLLRTGLFLCPLFMSCREGEFSETRDLWCRLVEPRVSTP